MKTKLIALGLIFSNNAWCATPAEICAYSVQQINKMDPSLLHISAYEMAPGANITLIYIFKKKGRIGAEISIALDNLRITCAKIGIVEYFKKFEYSKTMDVCNLMVSNGQIFPSCDRYIFKDTGITSEFIEVK